MGLVNPPQVTPGIMRALYRLCLAMGPEATATTEQYVDLLAPAHAVVSGKDPKYAARATVKEAQRLGVLVGDGNGDGPWRLKLSGPPPGSSDAAADQFFVRELRRLLLASQNNDPLFHEGDPEDEEAEREADERLSTRLAREFTRVQAWVLLRDPALPTLHMTYREDARSIERLQRRYEGRSLVVNSTRWASFRRWSMFLGFSRVERLAAQRQQVGLIPDPTRAVVDELAEIATEAEELPLVDLRARLAEELPVLDGGRYQSEVADHVGTDERQDEALSGPLALALLRTEKSDALRLELRSDFGRPVSVAGRPLTHVLFNGDGA